MVSLIGQRRDFTKHHVWLQQVSISSNDELDRRDAATNKDDFFVQLQIVSDIERHVVFSSGYLNGIPHGLQMADTARANRIAWIAAHSDQTGAAQWFASLRVVVPEAYAGDVPEHAAAVAFTMQVDRFTGDLFVGGWADFGSLVAESSATSHVLRHAVQHW
jgi:hypothetical protein